MPKPKKNDSPASKVKSKKIPAQPFMEDGDHIFNRLAEEEIADIDFGWRKFSLNLGSNIRDASSSDDDVIFGLTEFDDCKITLEVSMSDDTARETLIHEIFHCIAETVGLGGDAGHKPFETTNENLVTLMSRGVLLFINLNPKLANLLFYKEE